MAKLPKIKWVVCPTPTGPYRSFERRGWPDAHFVVNEKPVFRITCKDEYEPSKVKSGQHSHLTLHVALKSITDEQKKKHGPFYWAKIRRTFTSINEVKEAAPKILDVLGINLYGWSSEERE